MAVRHAIDSHRGHVSQLRRRESGRGSLLHDLRGTARGRGPPGAPDRDDPVRRSRRVHGAIRHRRPRGRASHARPVPRAGEGGDRTLRRAPGQVHRRRRDGRVRRPGHARGRSRARGAGRARAGGGLRRRAPDPRRGQHRRGRGVDGHRPAGRRGGGRRRREHREPPAVGRAARRCRDRRAHVDRGARPLRDRGARALHRQGEGGTDPFLGGASANVSCRAHP